MARTGPWKLSAELARRVALGAQGFADPKPAGTPDRRHMVRAMGRMEVVQLDSVPVVIRSQYLPFHSRLGPYKTALFDDVAYGSGLWFEAWAHEASLLPVASEPLFRWAKQSAREGKTWKNLAQVAKDKPQFVADILAEVQLRGSVTSADLDRSSSGSKKSGSHDGWWNRSDTKNALDWLFRIGEVGVRRTGNFAKVYSPLSDIVPAEILAKVTPDVEQAQRLLCLKAVRALGVGTAADIADYFRMPILETRKRLDELVENGQTISASVEGWDKPAFADPNVRAPRKVAASTVVSPFDPMVWNRNRTLRLFGFTYKLEIYTPAVKRRWGYYVLPVLHDTRLVGRLDVKTHRDAACLEIKGAYLETGCDASVEAVVESVISLGSLVRASTIKVGAKGNMSAKLRQLVS